MSGLDLGTVCVSGAFAQAPGSASSLPTSVPSRQLSRLCAQVPTYGCAPGESSAPPNPWPVFVMTGG